MNILGKRKGGFFKTEKKPRSGLKLGVSRETSLCVCVWGGAVENPALAASENNPLGYPLPPLEKREGQSGGGNVGHGQWRKRAEQVMVTAKLPQRHSCRNPGKTFHSSPLLCPKFPRQT